MTMSLVQNYVQYDQVGRLIGGGTLDPACPMLPERIVYTIENLVPTLDALYRLVEERYVDMTSGGPVLAQRPSLVQGLDTKVVPVREEIILTGIPACMVQFTGPISGTHEHQGGDLGIGFTIPGTYTVSFEAFPYKPVSAAVKVLPVSIAATASLR